MLWFRSQRAVSYRIRRIRYCRRVIIVSRIKYFITSSRRILYLTGTGSLLATRGIYSTTKTFSGLRRFLYSSMKNWPRGAGKDVGMRVLFLAHKAGKRRRGISSWRLWNHRNTRTHRRCYEAGQSPSVGNSTDTTTCLWKKEKKTTTIINICVLYNTCPVI